MCRVLKKGDHVTEVENQWTMMASGPSQLVYDFAALRCVSTSTPTTDVYYMGGHDHLIEGVMEELCRVFGARFRGTYEPAILHFEPRLRDLVGRGFFEAVFSPRSFARRFLASSYSIPEVQRNICLNLRQRCPYDSLLLTAVGAARVVLVADGVALQSIQRNTRDRWLTRGVDQTLATLPVTQTVWCPSYLLKSNELLGPCRAIAEDRLSLALEEASSIDSVTEATQAVASVSPGPWTVIYSQHLALSGICTESEEIAFFSAVAQGVHDLGDSRIIFKPHPRDSMEKLQALGRRIRDIGIEVHIPMGRAARVPGELLLLSNLGIVRHVGCTSSSLLSASGLTGRPVTVVTSGLFPTGFQQEILQIGRLLGVSPMSVDRLMKP